MQIPLNVIFFSGNVNPNNIYFTAICNHKFIAQNGVFHAQRYSSCDTICYCAVVFMQILIKWVKALNETKTIDSHTIRVNI